MRDLTSIMPVVGRVNTNQPIVAWNVTGGWIGRGSFAVTLCLTSWLLAFALVVTFGAAFPVALLPSGLVLPVSLAPTFTFLPIATPLWAAPWVRTTRGRGGNRFRRCWVLWLLRPLGGSGRRSWFRDGIRLRALQLTEWLLHSFPRIFAKNIP